jgi:hypothetical protein
LLVGFNKEGTIVSFAPILALGSENLAPLVGSVNIGVDYLLFQYIVMEAGDMLDLLVE